MVAVVMAVLLVSEGGVGVVDVVGVFLCLWCCVCVVYCVVLVVDSYQYQVRRSKYSVIQSLRLLTPPLLRCFFGFSKPCYVTDTLVCSLA